MQSNPTQTLVSTRTSGLQKATSPHTVTPANAPSISIREDQRNRLAFEQSLDRISQSDVERHERGDADEQAVNERPERENDEGNQGRREQDDDPKGGAELQGVGRLGASLFSGGVLATAATSLPMLSAEQLANLQRMAAAIAEVSKSGAEAKMTVDFGSTAGLATGAILGRDRNGALTVHLTGMPPFMSSAQMQSLRSELMQRLLRRKLAVSSVEYLDEARIAQRAYEPSNDGNQTPDFT
jgi:hypothetical protein